MIHPDAKTMKTAQLQRLAEAEQHLKTHTATRRRKAGLVAGIIVLLLAAIVYLVRRT